MILNDIKEALESVDPRVFYGAAEDLEDGEIWDYIVFSRDSMRTAAGKTGYTDQFTVGIVREEFVPDEDVDAVIGAMLAIPGIRLSGNEFTFEYARKPNTNTVCELLVLKFVRARKTDG